MGFTQASQSAAKWNTVGEGRVGGGGRGGSNHELGNPVVDFMSHANGPPSLDSIITSDRAGYM
jgi:hypothetical protein